MKPKKCHSGIFPLGGLICYKRYYDNRTLQERFTTALYKHLNNVFIKSTVRGGLPKNYWSSKCNPHTSNYSITNCDSSGKKIKFHTGYTKVNFTYAALKHYLKSFL